MRLRVFLCLCRGLSVVFVCFRLFVNGRLVGGLCVVMSVFDLLFVCRFTRRLLCKGVMYLSNIYVSSISSNGKYSCIIIVYKLCLCECTKVCETMRRA